MGEFPEGRPTRFNLLTPAPLGGFGWLFLLGYLVPIFLAPSPIKLVFVALLCANFLALVIGRGREQGILLDEQGLVLQYGYGPSIKVPYNQIREVSEKSGRDVVTKAATWLIRTRNPQFEPLDHVTKISLRSWRWVFFFTPIPAGLPTKTIRIPALDPAGLTDELNRRLQSRFTPPKGAA